MKPYKHACSSAVKYGGVWTDYIKIHNFMDSSKAHISDWRHRALFHSTFGCFIVEQVFGETLTNSEGKVVCTRDVAEDHVIEDLGIIPSAEQWLRNMRIEPWMGGKRSKDKREGRQASRKIPMTDTEKTDFISSLNEANTDGVRPINNIALENVTIDGARPSFKFSPGVFPQEIDDSINRIPRGASKLYD